ncbi:MAG TPA: ABC transporter permease, partial [Syntrophales bacterium]|nr:ABC transporter permease [Syntrophales bacterium]
MRRFATLYRHELQAVIQDRGVLLIFIGAVIIYSFFYPIPYLPEVLKEVPVVAVDEDHTALSRKLIRMADAGDLVRISGQASTVAEAEKRIKAGKASGVLVIPREFERKVLRGENATVGLFCDASYFLVYRQAMTGLLAATKTLSAGIEIRKLQGRGTMAAHAKAVRNPVLLINRPLFNPTEGYASYVVPAVMVLILQQTLLIGIGMLGGTRR